MLSKIPIGSSVTRCRPWSGSLWSWEPDRGGTMGAWLWHRRPEIREWLGLEAIAPQVRDAQRFLTWISRSVAATAPALVRISSRSR